jgi:hypothetical protein
MTDSRPKFSFATMLAPKADRPEDTKPAQMTREQIHEAWKRQTDKVNVRRGR